MTYGCQTWSMTKAVGQKLRVAQRAMERKMLGLKLTDKISCIEIRNKTQVSDIAQYIAKQKWKWAAHVARPQDNRWTLKITVPVSPPATLQPSQRLPATVRSSNSLSQSSMKSRVQQTSPTPVSNSSCTATPHDASANSLKSFPSQSHHKQQDNPTTTGRTTTSPSQTAVAAKLLLVNSVFYPSQPICYHCD
ncbi:endonuclease-reverse transcriptase [Elysia marginata]|uniref:Endonuclease-reverse transcriptase n=1 Tax=Elysia marginata TaxID=1093978 RepID=A0AAV4JML7_9GAST|nr:endonuclease-reverse transcriptase [Elysia marginata]